MLRLIEGGASGDLAQEHPRAIVTLAIGADYERVWSTLCRESWESYGRKFGYDIVVVTTPLDQSTRAQSRSPAWQKLLILDQPWSRIYDRIVWMDSDIIISPNAIDIVAYVPNRTQVGMPSTDQLSESELQIYFERLFGVVESIPGALDAALAENADDDFREFGLERKDCPEYNTGVIVFSPDAHNDLLLDVYNSFDQTGLRYEQIPLSYKLHHSGALKILSPRFNRNIHHALKLGFLPKFDPDAQELLRFVRNELSKAYFLHFAGSMGVMKLLVQMRENGMAL